MYLTGQALMCLDISAFDKMSRECLPVIIVSCPNLTRLTCAIYKSIVALRLDNQRRHLTNTINDDVLFASLATRKRIKGLHLNLALDIPELYVVYCLISQNSNIFV